MNIPKLIKQAWRWASGEADAERAAQTLRDSADAFFKSRAAESRGMTARAVTGRNCRPFAVERSSDRLWRRRIPLPDVLSWRVYCEAEGSVSHARLEVVCGVVRVGDHDEALRKIKGCVPPSDDRVDRLVVGPELLVGVVVTDCSGNSRALHLRDARLYMHEFSSPAFGERMTATYTFTGGALEWGDVPTTNDPDRPRVGINVGEQPSIETAPPTWAEN